MGLEVCKTKLSNDYINIDIISEKQKETTSQID